MERLATQLRRAELQGKGICKPRLCVFNGRLHCVVDIAVVRSACGGFAAGQPCSGTTGYARCQDHIQRIRQSYIDVGRLAGTKFFLFIRAIRDRLIGIDDEALRRFFIGLDQ